MGPLSKFDLKGEEIASLLVPSSSIAGDDEQDTLLLRKMSEDAKKYVSSFSWCKDVLDSYFGGGLGGVFAVFFLHIHPRREGIDPWIWAMVGDVPPAYLPLADCGSAADAFRIYIRGMSKWVELARVGQMGTPEQGVPPVDLPATAECAEVLSKKIYGLTIAVQPFFEDDEGQSTIVN